MSLLNTPPQAHFPHGVQEILDDFMARRPTSEPEIHATYHKYRKALMETELAFIAARLPNIINPVTSDPFQSRKDRKYGTYTLAGHVDTVISSLGLSREQNTIVKIWCRSLGEPIVRWQARLAEIRAVNVSQIEEINRTSKQALLRGQRPETKEIISQAYRTYRTQLLATAYGHLFNDLPSHLPSQIRLSDWKRIDNLRRLSRQKLEGIEESLSTADGVDYSALATQKLELGVRITGLSVLLGHIRQSWNLDLDDRVREAYIRLKKNLHGAWPTRLGLVVLNRLVEVRAGIKKRLLEPRGSTDLPKSKNAHFLAALDEFFEVVETPASFKSDAQRYIQLKSDRQTNARAEIVDSNGERQRKPQSSISSPASLQPSNVDALSQRVAALRSKLFEAPRDTSRDMIEEEIRRLEQSFKASSSYLTTSTGHNAQQLIDHSREKDAKDKYFQRKEAQSLGNNGKNSTQPQTDMRSSQPSVNIRKVFDVREPPLPLDRHTKMKGAQEFKWSGQNLGEVVKDIIPSKKSRAHFERAISPMFDSSVSTSQPNSPVSSDSAAISDLKIQVAELKDLVRGLIFQHMTIPGTYSGPPKLASMKASLLADDSAPTAPAEKPATMEPPLASKEAPQKSTNPPLVETPLVDRAPFKITYEMYPPDQDSRNAASKETSQVVQYQTSQSLLAELFPEETKVAVAEERREGPGSPGRIPIPHVPLISVNDSGTERHSTGISPVRRVRAKGPDLTPKSTVLELRYASKSLTEEDFRTLIPRGVHMHEWTQRGEFVKVIPKRDPWTLEQTGNYYIVFNSEENAKAYKQHVSHVHDLAKQHTPTSLTSEIAPPPGYTINGEDVSSLVQSYALIPPQQKLFLQYLVAPFTPLQQNIFKRGGYAQILGEGREGAAQVLVVFLEGRQPSYFEISDAVHLDGKRRGLEWKLLPGETAIRKVDRREPKKKEEASLFDRDFEMEGEVDVLSELEAEGGKRKRTAQDRAKAPTYGQRWILSFENVEEAKRFALQWHGRAFPWHDRALRKWQGKGFGEQVLMVRAEFLW